jgi:putative transposase
MTGFDGSDFLEFGNGYLDKIAKLCSHLDKLKSKHDFRLDTDSNALDTSLD